MFESPVAGQIFRFGNQRPSSSEHPRQYSNRVLLSTQRRSYGSGYSDIVGGSHTGMGTCSEGEGINPNLLAVLLLYSAQILHSEHVALDQQIRRASLFQRVQICATCHSSQEMSSVLMVEWSMYRSTFFGLWYHSQAKLQIFSTVLRPRSTL